MGTPASFYKQNNANTSVSITEPLPVSPTGANSSSYITTATTTVVKSGAGCLHTVSVLGGTLGTVTIYDNTAASGTILAVLSATSPLSTYTFDIAFGTGLTIVTAAATNVQVSYR